MSEILNKISVYKFWILPTNDIYIAVASSKSTAYTVGLAIPNVYALCLHFSDQTVMCVCMCVCVCVCVCVASKNFVSNCMRHIIQFIIS